MFRGFMHKGERGTWLRHARDERDGERRGHGHGRMGHGGRGGGRGERLGRFFAHGDLRLVILSMLAERPRHGYEIIKEIEERVGGAYTPSPGVIYPTLTWLEELGYATVTESEGKRSHSITDAGRMFAEANRQTLDAILARIDEAGRARADGPSPQVVRAMEGLRMALRLRFQKGPFTTDQAQAVAAALDAATALVEKG